MEDKHRPDITIFCYWCGSPSYIVWIHGHGQCSNCGLNIDECCRGEICYQPNNTSQERMDEKVKRQ